MSDFGISEEQIVSDFEIGDRADFLRETAYAQLHHHPKIQINQPFKNMYREG